MKLKHVYHGRTPQEEYYWFVLFEENDIAELVLTMPENKITPAISIHFEEIKDAFTSECAQNQSNNYPQYLTSLETQYKFEKWITSSS